MHVKISEMPKEWPIARKGRKYVAKTSHAFRKSIPILFILRDILKIAENRKEVKRILLEGKVKINNKVRKDEKFPVQVLDVIQIEKTGKAYKLDIVSKKYALEEIKGDAVNKKTVKISGKKTRPNKKVQMNLEDGKNYLVTLKFSPGDSVIINTKENKIEKILPLKENAKVEIIGGKHAGEEGVVKKIENIGKRKTFLVKLKDGEVSLPLKTMLVVG